MVPDRHDGLEQHICDMDRRWIILWSHPVYPRRAAILFVQTGCYAAIFLASFCHFKQATNWEMQHTVGVKGKVRVFTEYDQES